MKLIGAVVASLVLAAAALPFAPAAVAAERYDLKLSTFQPLNNHMTLWLQAWAALLGERSGGRLAATVYPSDQLGAMPRQYDLARTGIADVALAMHGSTPGRFPLTELSHVPFVIPNSEIGSRALTQLLPRYLGAEHKGVHVLCLSSGTPLALLTTKVAVRRPEDLKGLRIRHPDGIAAATLAALGAVPVYTETSQIADSLNKGTIDGALLAWEALESFQVTARYATDWGGNVTTFALVMNPATYDKLPGDLKALIDETTGPAGAREIGRMADHAAEGGHAYARRNGIEIIDLTPAERTAFDLKARDEIAKVIVERQGKGLLAREFVDDLKAQVAALGEGSGE